MKHEVKFSVNRGAVKVIEALERSHAVRRTLAVIAVMLALGHELPNVAALIHAIRWW